MRRLFYPLFPSGRGGAMGNVLEWEIFSDAEQRHISMNSNKTLDWLYAESNKLCCKERRNNVYFNAQSNLYLLKHFEEYLMLSKLFFSMICLELNFSCGFRQHSEHSTRCTQLRVMPRSFLISKLKRVICNCFGKIKSIAPEQNNTECSFNCY